MFASRMSLGAHKSPLQILQSVPNYLATFDSRVAASVLNSTGPDTPATSGQTVIRWNSLDNAGVYFSQSDAGKRPSLNANGGVGNTGSGQRMTGTGITGLSNARTVIVVYRSPDTGTTQLFDSPNASFAASSINQTVMRISAANGGGSTQDVATAIGSVLDRIALVRKSGNAMDSINSITRTFGSTANSPVTAEAGLNLFSFGITDSTANKNNIIGLVIIQRAVSNDEAQVLLDAAHLYFGTNTAQQIVKTYDVWGQSNASGFAATTGITAFDGIDPEKNFMVVGNDMRKYDFEANQNFGSDATGSQFGAESELLRLTANANNCAAVIKYGLGSTSLAVEWNPTTPGAQYTASRARAASARLALKSRGLQVQTKGLLWAQGERDASDVVNGSAAYQSRLETLVANYRATFGENIPVAVVKIKVTLGGYSHLAAVQAAQAAAVTAMGNALLIDTTSDVNFPLFDGIHFAPTAQINIGAVAYAFFNS